MPPKPPTAHQQEYTQRPPRVYAEQYHTGDPLPPGATPGEDPPGLPIAGGPYLSTLTGMYPLHDTDWILTDTYSGLATTVLADADFQLQYVKATGPPVPG
jgi:hypothetical protein